MENRIGLSYFQKILAKDLQDVDREMLRLLSSDVSLVDKVVRYIVRRKGKSLRPILTLLCAHLFGSPSYQAIKVAVIAELLHTATLVHDDVVDNAKLRRNYPSINAIWRNKVSVLVGDYLLAKALTEMLDLRDFTVLDILSKTAKRMSRGELLQIAKARKLDITEEIYFDMIGDKTAALFSACCELAAVTSGSNGLVQSQLSTFGEKLGTAFQVRDDILDFESRKSILGKPVLGDLKEKKITLPLIHAIRNSDKNESRKIIRMIDRGLKAKDQAYILDFIQRHEGMTYAKETAQRIINEARQCLKSFPDSQTKWALESFARYAVSRTR